MIIHKKPHNCLVLLGPTASGKTRLACELAFHLDAEIISADSRQVYKGLDIGTGKDLDAYQVKDRHIPVHLINVCEPSQKFFLHDFMRQSLEAFQEIKTRKKVPLFCGGTGLYLDALQKDFSLTQIGEDQELRQDLLKLKKEDLLKRLQSYPKEYTSQVDTSSVKRMVRGIEIAEHFKKHGLPQKTNLPFAPYYLGIEISKDQLHDNIAKRLRSRMDNGLLKEAQDLAAQGLSHERMRELGLEYKFLSMYLKKELQLDEMLEKLETAIKQFAKRQMTWFRKMEREGVKINWVSPQASASELCAELGGYLERH